MKRAKPVPELTPADVARFQARLLRDTDPDGCWLWTGARGSSGYGLMRVGDRVVTVHRIAYTLAHGQVPEGLVVDHAGPAGQGCASKLCARGDHLEAVSQDVNTARQYLRGERPSYLTPEERAYFDQVPDSELQEVAGAQS